MSYIGLLDCNNFFVSCERLFRPDLEKRPTVVLSSNDGCVVARSAEVKAMGIPMGVPYFKVKDEFKAADVAVFSSNFRLYRDISRRVMAVLREEVGQMEQYSVDEAFFLIQGRSEDVVKSLKELKAIIENKVGVPVSVGAAKTKTIAKYASEVGKKGSGTCFLSGDEWKTLAARVSINEIWGIGGKTATKLRELNIDTVADYLAIDTARLQKLFGIGGVRKQAELREQAVYLLGESDDSLQQSIMSSRSFAKVVKNKAMLEDAVRYHVEHAASELREIGGVAQSLGVSLRPSRHGDWAFQGGSEEVLLTEPTSDTRVLMREAVRLVARLYQADVPYKKAGVLLGSISAEVGQSGSLFTDEKVKRPKLMAVMDTLNDRLGKGTIALGRIHQSGKWESSKQFVSPHYTTKWSDIPFVGS